MEEIEVGEYVRFNNGEIGKVIDIKENPSRIVYSEYGEIGLISDIVKHSKKLIDLIEVGDYVNGKYVKKINQYKDGKSIIALIGIIEGQDIKSIVTHEQFERIEYKVEEDK